MAHASMALGCLGGVGARRRCGCRVLGGGCVHTHPGAQEGGQVRSVVRINSMDAAVRAAPHPLHLHLRVHTGSSFLYDVRL